MTNLINKYFSSGDDKNILKAIVVLVFFVVLAKLAGLFKEIVIAWRFGISAEIDAFNFLFSFVQWPVSLFGSIMGAILIPLVSKIRFEGLIDEVKIFRAELLGITVLISLFIMCFFYFIFHKLLINNEFALDPIQISIVSYFLPYLIWVIPLGFLSVLFSAWTMASKRHINTFLEATPALFISILVLFWDNSFSIVLGLLFGFLFQSLSLTFLLHNFREIELPKFSFRSPNWKPFFSVATLMVVGQFFISLISIVDQYFAARLGVGAISTLSYAEKILAIVLGLGVLVVGRALLPIFSDAHNQGLSLRPIALRWTGIIFTIGFLGCIVFLFLSKTIVEVLFERGSFDLSDTKKVSKLLQLGSLQIPFYIGGMVLSYAIISLRRYKVLVFFNAFLIFLKIVSIHFLIDFGFQINAIPISTVIVYVFSFFLCFIYIYSRLK